MFRNVRQERGAVLVEFTLVFFMFTMLVLVFLQLGFWFFGILTGDRAIADVQSSFANSVDINFAIEDTVANGRILSQALIEPMTLDIELTDLGETLEYDFDETSNQWTQVAGPAVGDLECETTLVRITYVFNLDQFILPGGEQTRQATTAFTCLT